MLEIVRKITALDIPLERTEGQYRRVSLQIRDRTLALAPDMVSIQG
jgi:hypothetical protein